MKKLSVVLSVMVLLGFAGTLMAQDAIEPGVVEGSEGGALRAGPRLVARGVAVAGEDYKIMAVHLHRASGEEPIEPQPEPMPLLDEADEANAETAEETDEAGTVEATEPAAAGDVTNELPEVKRPGRPDGIFRFGARIFAITNLRFEVGEGQVAAANGGGPGMLRSFTGELRLLKHFGPLGKADAPVSSADADGDEIDASVADEALPAAAGGTISGTVHPAEASTNRTVPVLDGEATVDGTSYRLLGRVTPVRPLVKKMAEKLHEKVKERIKKIREDREKRQKPDRERLDRPTGKKDRDVEEVDQADVVEDAF